MKILAGSFKNRSLILPKHGTFRPTLAKTRAMVFNICQQEVVDARFLDLFAATGAMGFEALSRGAKRAVLVDNNRSAVQAMRSTADMFEVKDKVEILCLDVVQAVQSFIRRGEIFDIIFIDPPYFRSEEKERFSCLHTLLALIDTSNCLMEGGLLFLEDAKKSPVETIPLTTLMLSSKRPCGDAYLSLFTKKGSQT